jgi:hypothetical protein
MKNWNMNNKKCLGFFQVQHIIYIWHNLHFDIIFMFIIHMVLFFIADK